MQTFKKRMHEPLRSILEVRNPAKIEEAMDILRSTGYNLHGSRSENRNGQVGNNSTNGNPVNIFRNSYRQRNNSRGNNNSNRAPYNNASSSGNDTASTQQSGGQQPTANSGSNNSAMVLGSANSSHNNNGYNNWNNTPPQNFR